MSLKYTLRVEEASRRPSTVCSLEFKDVWPCWSLLILAKTYKMLLDMFEKHWKSSKMHFEHLQEDAAIEFKHF